MGQLLQVSPQDQIRSQASNLKTHASNLTPSTRTQRQAGIDSDGPQERIVRDTEATDQRQTDKLTLSYSPSLLALLKRVTTQYYKRAIISQK